MKYYNTFRKYFNIIKFYCLTELQLCQTHPTLYWKSGTLFHVHEADEICELQHCLRRNTGNNASCADSFILTSCLKSKHQRIAIHSYLIPNIYFQKWFFHFFQILCRVTLIPHGFKLTSQVLKFIIDTNGQWFYVFLFFS